MNTCVDPDRGPPEKSQVAIGLFRNSCTDHPRQAIGPLGSSCFSRDVRTALCKYVDDLKTLSGSTHAILLKYKNITIDTTSMYMERFYQLLMVQCHVSQSLINHLPTSHDFHCLLLLSAYVLRQPILQTI